MTLPETALACLVLLIVPGPTNALLALSGAQGGLRAGFRLTLVALGAYLAVVGPLTFLGAGLAQSAPQLMLALRLAAAFWVIRLAVKLWRLPEPGVAPHRVRLHEVAITTLLNPKGLIFGLVILPKTATPLPGLVVFALAVILASAVWLALGRLVLRRDSPGLRRGGAVVLVGLAAVVLRGAFA